MSLIAKVKEEMQRMGYGKAVYEKYDTSSDDVYTLFTREELEALKISC